MREAGRGDSEIDGFAEVCVTTPDSPQTAVLLALAMGTPRWVFGCVFGRKRFIDFVAQAVEDLVSGAGHLDFLEVAGAGKIDEKLFLDASGAEGHEGDTIAQADRLAHVVGDEDDGASGFGPDLFQLVV